ncbi:MAG: hypothetical protein RI897_3047 [Verrucomicrobiota bacterium]|jgi:hypothetical protein
MGLELLGGADLEQASMLEDGDSGLGGECVLWGVGDEQRGEPGFLLELQDGGAELSSERGVEVGEGFIEEEDGGLADEGFGEGGALLFAAGDLAGELVEEWGEFEFGCEVLDAVGDFVAGDFLDFEG